MADTLIADGSLLSWQLPSENTTWHDIEDAVSVDPPSITCDTIEAPKLLSKFKKKRSGKPGGDDGGIVVQYGHDEPFLVQILEWYADGAPPEINFRLLLEDGSGIVWPALLGGLKGPNNMEEGGRLEYEVPYTLNGIPEIIDPVVSP